MTVTRELFLWLGWHFSFWDFAKGCHIIHIKLQPYRKLKDAQDILWCGCVSYNWRKEEDLIWIVFFKYFQNSWVWWWDRSTTETTKNIRCTTATIIPTTTKNNYLFHHLRVLCDKSPKKHYGSDKKVSHGQEYYSIFTFVLDGCWTVFTHKKNVVNSAIASEQLFYKQKESVV